jgi:hypothetical protein
LAVEGEYNEDVFRSISFIPSMKSRQPHLLLATESHKRGEIESVEKEEGDRGEEGGVEEGGRCGNLNDVVKESGGDVEGGDGGINIGEISWRRRRRSEYKERRRRDGDVSKST